LYDRRFDAFRTFYESFYRDVPNLLRVRPEADVNLFELFGGRVAVAAFNSCIGNDCFAFHGAIRAEAIAQTQLDLNDSGNYDLHIAVWHHGLDGSPYQTDYMDVECVRSMVGRGFRLGLHGHQHRSEVTPYSIQLPGKESMVVVSSGSLCAGRHDLPTGTHRQYNVIDICDDFRHARIHVREMTVGTQFGASRRLSFGGSSFVDVEWSPPVDVFGRAVDHAKLREQALVQKAERALMSGDPVAAITALRPLSEYLKGHGRRILLAACNETKNWELTISVMHCPESVDELIALVKANGELGRWGAAREAILAHGARVDLPRSIQNELEQWVATKEALVR
jgi:hypothetical protein